MNTDEPGKIRICILMLTILDPVFILQNCLEVDRTRRDGKISSNSVFVGEFTASR